MSGYPYGVSPVNIFQTPYSPQGEDLQRLMAEFQTKYQQILQGNQPQYQQNQQQQQVVEQVERHEDNQKLVLDYLYDVHGITPQQFQWEFEEYCNVIKEREQKLEQEIKQKVREKIVDGGQQVKAESALSDTIKREPAEPIFKEVQSKQTQLEVQQKTSGQNKGGYKK